MTMALLSGNVSHREGTGKRASICFSVAKCTVIQNIPLAARHSFAAAMAFHFISLAVHKKILIFLCDHQNGKCLIPLSIMLLSVSSPSLCASSLTTEQVLFTFCFGGQNQWFLDTFNYYFYLSNIVPTLYEAEMKLHLCKNSPSCINIFV